MSARVWNAFKTEPTEWSISGSGRCSGGVVMMLVLLVLYYHKSCLCPLGWGAPQPPFLSSSLCGLEGTWRRGRWAAAKTEATQRLRLG